MVLDYGVARKINISIPVRNPVMVVGRNSHPKAKITRISKNLENSGNKILAETENKAANKKLRRKIENITRTRYVRTLIKIFGIVGKKL